MASFDLSTAIKIVPEFTGNRNELSNFISLVEMIDETLKAEEKPKLIKFIIKARISDKVKNKLSSVETPITILELKTTLENSFPSNKTTLSLHTELSKIKQGNLQTKNYAEKIENITAELNKIQISELGEKERKTITSLNDKIALNAFKNGLNDSIKMTVLASRPKTLQEAVSLAIECSSTTDETNLFQYNRNYKTKYNPKYNNKYMNNNNNYKYNNNNSNNHNKYNNHNGNNGSRIINNRINNNNGNRNNTYRNNNYRNNYGNYKNNNKNIHYTQRTGNESVPGDHGSGE